MTQPPDTELVEVTEADREAAASFYDKHLSRPGEVPVAAEMRMGRIDESPLVQAFARHRLASSRPISPELAEIVERLRALLEKGAHGPWFIRARPTNSGLSVIEDGTLDGMFPVTGEAHEIALIVEAINALPALLDHIQPQEVTQSLIRKIMDEPTMKRALLALPGYGVAEAREALKLAITHIEHMAAWIGPMNKRTTRGYSFEGLGEDMPGIKAALANMGER